jgi:threonylcarbamoyladenosine tRNA methylthiotransferase MtaB
MSTKNVNCQNALSSLISFFMKFKTVALHTLGCRLNISETGSLTDEFVKRGYQLVPFGQKADVVLINTCTVTDNADSSCRNLIRKANRTSPEGKIIVVGCYSQMEPQAVASLEGVDLVLGTADKNKVFNYLDEPKQIIDVAPSMEFSAASTSTEDSHTRAFLKIQDGCNYICSFCIIPKARGRSRAISLEDAIKRAKELINQGFQEIILTGVNIGEYQKASGTPLYKLIDSISQLPGLKRLRLSSVEPNTFDDDLIKVLKDSPNIMDHFHLPLQSANDTILKAMRRKYTISQYAKTLDCIKSAFPQASIGADIILGHPGETREQFFDTFNFLKNSPITHFHPFPYSKRKNTLSAGMNDHLPHQEKKKRVSLITALGRKKLLNFSAQQIGRSAPVLFEKGENGIFSGYTPNYVKVYLPSALDISNQIKTVKLTELVQGRLFAKELINH